MEVRTLDKYSSIAQLDLSECVPTVFTSMPNFLSPMDLTCDVMKFLVCVEEICFNLPLVWKVLTVVFSHVLGYANILFTSAAHASTGQRLVPLDARCWVMHASFSPFF